MKDKDSLFKIAKTILIFCFIITFMGVVSEILDPDHNIFETLLKMIEPVITLIIGYLFGKKGN
jgi:hypothetical protein